MIIWKNNKNNSPYVYKYVEYFDQVVKYVYTTILEQPDHTGRVSCVRKFLRITEQFFAMNNFQGCFAIMAGLENTSIQRLSSVWNSLDKESLDLKEQLMIFTNSHPQYRPYKDLLKQSTLPCIPYLGVQIMDYCFIENGSSDAKNGRINFKKYELLYKHREEMFEYQKHTYPFKENEELKELLEIVRGIEKMGAFNLSLEIEPIKEPQRRRFFWCM